MIGMFTDIQSPVSIEYGSGDGSVRMKEFHYHNSYEIYFLVEGRRNYIIGEEYFSLSKGDVALIKPGVLHKTAGKSFDRIVMYFTDEFIDTYFTKTAFDILLRCFAEKIISLPVDGQARIMELFERISEVVSLGAQTTIFVYVADILNILFENMKDSGDERILLYKENKTITRILHYINKNYAQIENITQIAEDFYITKYHLCRIFKGATNVSVIEYLNRVKVKSSCILLDSTDKSITEICTECGFNSSVYFSKLFKRLMNMTPSQYRKRKIQ